jgi:pimeloyl-ACP methyl ester carboxylesterase
MALTKKNKAAVKVPKWIMYAVKILETLSPVLAAKLAMKLFTTPIRFKLPKREQTMDNASRQQQVIIKSLGKSINVYRLGSSQRKVLLVHGWSGRGTQLYSIADKLVQQGFETISFDAPAHGKSTGKTSDMTEFITAIFQLEKQFGPFDYAVGHSLGAMAVLNSIKSGLNIKKAVLISSGDIIEDIMLYFTHKLGMKIATGRLMMQRFEKKFGQTLNSYSAYIAAQDVNIPVLMFHDEEDTDVPVTAAYHIKENLAHAKLIITRGLGHRKILGDKNVIKNLLNFLNDDEQTNDIGTDV